MPQGTANNIGTNWWEIVDGSGNQAARFDHQLFPNIRDGATVTYVDADGDGIAENVQPAAAVTRYMARATQTAPLDDEIQAQILDGIMIELAAAANEPADGRQKRLRRLQAKRDRLDV